jgi:hypothetical protein
MLYRGCGRDLSGTSKEPAMSHNIRFATAALAAALAFAAAKAPAADLCVDLALRCNGFEPNWQFTFDPDAGVVDFTDPENPNWETQPLSVEGCMFQGSPNDYELNADAPLSLQASITEQNCTEPSGEISDFSVSATFNQGALTGNPNRVTGTGCCVRLD